MVLIGYDGTRAAEQAVREAAVVLATRHALVVVVWKAGLAFELMELPTSTVGLPPAPLDIRTALEADQALYEAAQRAAERAAQLARTLGLDAEPLIVAEDPEIEVAETLVRLAREREAEAIAIGAHARSGLLGSTCRAVIKTAPCPVLVVRSPVE